MNCEALLDRLSGVRQRSSGQWSARCPAHDDTSPSLSVKELPDGRILLHCFAGCDIHAITSALGIDLSDLYPKPLGHSVRGIKRHRLISPTQALEIINLDALFVAVTACDLARQSAIQEAIKEKLLLAAARINLALRNAL